MKHGSPLGRSMPDVPTVLKCPLKIRWFWIGFIGLRTKGILVTTTINFGAHKMGGGIS